MDLLFLDQKCDNLMINHPNSSLDLLMNHFLKHEIFQKTKKDLASVIDTSSLKLNIIEFLS